MKKLFLILSIMIIASCAGCGSSNSTDNSEMDKIEEISSEDTVEETASEENVSEDNTSEEIASEEIESEEIESEETASESDSKYNAFIDEYASFEVTSTNLNNGVWDDNVSFTGSNKSPQLKWDAVDGTDHYVIIMDDLEAWDILHWKSDNVTETSLAEGWAPSTDYVGPNPPTGSTHTYEIYVIALKAPVERVKGALGGQNPKFEENFRSLDIDADGNSGNIIAVGRLSGTYSN